MITILDTLTHTTTAIIECDGKEYEVDCSELLESYEIETVEGDRFLGYKTVTPKLYEINERDLIDYVVRVWGTKVKLIEEEAVCVSQ